MTLRPFFSYFGCKWRDARRLYPEPRFETIVEPFAGAAGYATRHADRRVVLCDLDPYVVGVWDFLIRSSSADILALPDVAEGQRVGDLPVCQEARWLVGFWVNRASEQPRQVPSPWMRSGKWPGSFWGPRTRERIAAQVDRIRHWRVFQCTYDAAPVIGRATWFVDAPYLGKGVRYRFGSELLDYAELAAWCRSRPGQVIACENDGAVWLPFRPLAETNTARQGTRSREVVWLSDERAQLDLFRRSA